MTDRRRIARLAALVAAALAVAGTSAIPPSPGPTQQVSLGGSVHLSAQHPVAIQPIDVDVRQGNLMSVEFNARLAGLPPDGRVIATIVPGSESSGMSGGPVRPDPSTGPGTRVAYTYNGCANPCPGAYLLVITWVGAPSGGAADVAWSMDAVARYPDIYPGGTPQPGAAAITASSNVVTPKTADLRTVTSGKPLHLTETDRVRAWTVTVHRHTDDVDPHSHNRFSWVGQARLELSATQTAGGAFGDGTDRREAFRSDPPVFVQVVGDGAVPPPGTRSLATWAGQPAIAFDPFARCAEGECDATFSVEMVWRDGRPDTAFDASWTLDVASIARDFSGSLGEVDVEVVEALPSSNATASGSFEIAGAQLAGQSQFALPLPGFDPAAVGAWADLGIPTRGRGTARLTLISESPPPPEAEFLISTGDSGYGGTGALGGLGTQVALRPGEAQTFAFEPVVHCQSAGTMECHLEGTVSARRQPSNQVKFPADLRLRVDWSIELAAPKGNAPPQIVVDPSASVRP